MRAVMLSRGSDRLLLDGSLAQPVTLPQPAQIDHVLTALTAGPEGPRGKLPRAGNDLDHGLTKLGVDAGAPHRQHALGAQGAAAALEARGLVQPGVSRGSQPPTQLRGALEETIDQDSFDPDDHSSWPEWPSDSQHRLFYQLDLLRWAYETSFRLAARAVFDPPWEPYDARVQSPTDDRRPQNSPYMT